MPTICGYDCDVYWSDLTGKAFGVIDNIARTWYEVVGVTNIPTTLDEPRINIKGMGSRTRTFKNAINQEDTISLEFGLEETANSNWALTQEIVADFTETTPCQIGLVVRVDTDKDGTMDTWIYAYGNILNTATFNINSNDYTKVKLDFLTQRLSVVAAEVDTPTYTAIASPSIETFVSATLQKTEDGVDDDWTNLNSGNPMDEVIDYTVVLSNNAVKLPGLAGQLYCRDIVLGASTVTGSFKKSFIGLEEIQEIQGEKTGRLIHTIASGETIQVENVNYDTLSIDFGETAPLFQTVPWTGDSYSFP